MTDHNSAARMPDEVIPMTTQQRFAEVIGRSLAQKWEQQQKLQLSTCVGRNEAADQVSINNSEQDHGVPCSDS